MNRGIMRTADFWAGIGMTLVGIACLSDALKIFQPPALSDMLGPRTFPFGLSASLMVLGAAITLRSVVRGGPPADLGQLRVLVVVAGSIAAYALAFQRLGYVVATALFLAFLFVYLGERRHWLTGIVSLGATLALYYGFGQVLHVDLPRGPLGF